MGFGTSNRTSSPTSLRASTSIVGFGGGRGAGSGSMPNKNLNIF